MSAPLLEVAGAGKRFERGILGREATTALDDVSLTVPDAPPQIIAIAGESGSGKTTLARLLLGIERPTTGAVRYRGRDMRALSREARRRLRCEVQPIFQDPFEAYNPFYRVEHVMRMPALRLGLARTRADAATMIADAVEQVGLRPDEILRRYPHELSGGQRQRLMMARALLVRPRVIVADEPVSMVDASLRATMLEGLRELHRSHGISIVYVTHDLTTAFQIADTIVILFGGRVVESGRAEATISAPRHPYTRLLIESIPRVDLDRRWADTRLAQQPRSEPPAPEGCNFAGRCTLAVPLCRRAPPPLVALDDGRSVRCFLATGAAAAALAPPAHRSPGV
jgi:peptide/nickel transport system ATP-binding protein